MATRHEVDEELLTAEASAAPGFDSLVELANDLLGIRRYRPNPALSRAVSLQVNFLVASGIDAEVYASGSRGGRSWSYRSGPDGQPFPVSPAARAVVDSVVGSRSYANTQSARTA